ncbi:MAG: hypothetical protein MK240_02775 [Opitutales bacterium]|nr:hypothetical protein [Opitutales bacterium]
MVGTTGSEKFKAFEVRNSVSFMKNNFALMNDHQGATRYELLLDPHLEGCPYFISF